MLVARLVLALIPCSVAACSSEPSPRTSAPLPPSEEVPGFAVADTRAWCLIGNELTSGHDSIALVVEAPAGVEVVDAWTRGAAVRMSRDGPVFRHTLEIGGLGPGEYEVLLAADGNERAFARVAFTRSHPLYVVTTTDWDTADNPDENLERHVELHRRHPELKITHLVGPYTFTDLELAPERVEELAAWARGMRDTYGDEIGVHIHPYKSFVEASGVSFRTEPSNSRPDGDPTGYTVNLDAYSEEDLTAMLEMATTLFEENGLGRPTSFRAGAWTADIKVLRALANAGYLADTSALNWSRLEEWMGFPLYEWVTTNWAPIDGESQPYYPNTDDILSSAAPNLPVLEVPDNAALVDYVSGAEMIEVFRSNWPGGALAEPKALSIGWHPPNFGERFFERIEEALVEFDRHLASADAGPVVYANLTDMVKVWKR